MWLSVGVWLSVGRGAGGDTDKGLPEVWLSRDLPQFCNLLTSPSCRKLTGCAAGVKLSGSQWYEAGGSVSK